METWDAIRSRRNVRRYSDAHISPGDLERILEAGRRAPSSRNWQPWHFVVVSDRAQLTELAEVWRGAGHVRGSAATVALVAEASRSEQDRDRLHYDLGQATANMMLAAVDLGIGSGHSAVADQERAQRVLGFPAGYFCAYLIAFGYPDDRPLRPIISPNRRPFDDVVHWTTW